MKTSVKMLKRRTSDNKKRIDRLKKELSLADLKRKKLQSELKTAVDSEKAAKLNDKKKVKDNVKKKNTIK